MLLVSGTVRATPAEYAPGPRSLEWVDRYGYVPGDFVDFRFGDRGTWVPVVDARVAGRRVRLVFDTGTNGYAALDEATMRELQLPIEGWSEFLDASGEPAGRIPRTRASTLELASLRLVDVPVGGVGPERITGERRGYVGTIGWSALEGGRFTIDYSNRRIAISSEPLPGGLASCATRYVTSFVSPPRLDGLLLVAARLEGHALLAEVDTGKSKTVLDPGIDSIRSFEHGDRGLEIAGLRLGPFELTTRFGRMGRGFDSFSRGVEPRVLVGLGSDLLSRFLLTVDYPTRTIVFEEADCRSEEDE